MMKPQLPGTFIVSVGHKRSGIRRNIPSLEEARKLVSPDKNYTIYRHDGTVEEQHWVEKWTLEEVPAPESLSVILK